MAEMAQSKEVAKWAYEIDRYDKRMEKWTKRCVKIVKRYADDRSGVTEQKESRYNALWSNIQTLQPALYAKLPKPEIDRRYKDADPVGRMSSELLQRCASFALTNETHAVFRQALLDYLLCARGTAWVRYVPHFRDASVLGPSEVKDDGAEISDHVTTSDDPAPDQAAQVPAGEDAAPVEEVAHEEAIVDYVHWKDFGHTEARTWEEVRAGWKIAYLGEEALCERFGDKVGKAIPLNWGAKDSDTETDKENRDKKAAIYEIWDKVNRCVIWICKDYSNVLDKRDDPLGLTNFFPFPKPLYATLTNEKLDPIPDYTMYQDQALQLDDLTGRIKSITKSLKVAGVYDASAQGVERLLNEGVENTLVPVDAWAAFAEKGGLKGAIELLPLADIATTLRELYECREKVKGDMYEITGMSDIVRGDTDADETASAQKIKGQYAGVRMQDRRQEVQRFIRDTLNIMVQVIASHFSADTLKKMSGLQMFDSAQDKQMAIQATMPQPPMMGQPQAAPPAPASLPGGAPQPGAAAPAPGMPPDETMQAKLENPTWEEVIALIRDDTLRSFRIDIETDSTVAADEAQEKKDRGEFLTKVGGFMKEAMPIAEANPAMAPLLAQLLMFAVRSFRVGRQLEGDFETFIAKLQKAAAQPQQPKPNPELVKIQAGAQADAQNAQLKAQLDQQTLQIEARVEAQKAATEAQLEQHRQALEAQKTAQQNQLEAQRAALEAHNQAQLEAMRIAADKQTAMMENQFKLLMERLSNAKDVEVAEIGAQATMDAAQLGAARAATQGESNA